MTYLQDSNTTIRDQRDVAKVFVDLLSLEDKIDQDKEHFYVMHLDVKNHVKMVELVSLGTLNSSLVHPREIFRRAVIAGSASTLWHTITHSATSSHPMKIQKSQNYYLNPVLS